MFDRTTAPPPLRPAAPAPTADPAGAPSPPAVEQWAQQLGAEQLESHLRATAAELAAGTHRLLVLVAEFDRRGAFERWECRSTVDWLAWHCGISPTAAREQVRVARRLEDLPLTSAAFAAGRVSYSKVRAISRVATIETEHDFLHLAESSTAGQLERICAALRRHGAPADDERQVRADELGADARAVVTWRRNEHGDLVGSFCLPAEAGDTFVRAVGAAVSADDVAPEGCRRARALARVAGAFLTGPPAADPPATAAPPPGDRTLPEVVVHVDLAALGRLAGVVPEADDPLARRTVARTSTGSPISTAALERLLGEAGLRFVAALADGTQLDLGRHQRHVTPALLRALRARDRHCRFPGCTSTTQLHAHHITWWSRGGPTSRDNLLLLCRKHHHAVHERRWTCSGPATEPRFARPNGEQVTHGPPPHAGASAEALERSNRWWVGEVAESPGGSWAGDAVDWDYLFAALADRVRLAGRRSLVGDAAAGASATTGSAGRVAPAA